MPGDRGIAQAGNVFVSYARDDGVRVGELVAGLRDAGLEVWIDTSSIEPTADWMAEIRRAIESSDATVVFLSGSFFESVHCAEELDWIREGGKKVVPVALEEIESSWTQRWEWLRQLNWVIGDPSVPVDAVVDKVSRAVASDLEWSSEHARLLVRAREWDLSGRPSSRLLRGSDIAVAEAALVRERPPAQPQPTELQRRFVAESRRGRGRFLRIVVGAVVVAAVVSMTLAVVALQQRNSARSALAESEFRRLSIESASATTQSDSLRLALAAVEQADEANLAGPAVVTLARALARSDLPLMHFTGLPDTDGVSGARQGIAVSGDGSTLAFATTDGRVRIVDLWEVQERPSVEPFAAALTAYGAGYEIGLDHTGEHLVRLAVPEYPEGGVGFEAELELYDLTGSEPERTRAEQVGLSSPAAGVAFAPGDLIVVAEDEGTATIVDVGGDGAEVAHLGTREPRSDASYLTVNFSPDGSRICTLGARLQVYQADPAEQLLDVANDRWALDQRRLCLPESCGFGGGHVMATNQDDELECVGSGGTSLGVADYSFITDASLVALRGLDELAWDASDTDLWSMERPTGEGLAPNYAYLGTPTDLIRPIGLGFAVPGPDRPLIVNLGADGDIDLWPVGSGVMPAERDLVADEVVTSLLGGQLSTDGDLIGLGPAEGGVELVDALTGEALSPPRTLPIDPDGLSHSEWLLADGSILTIDVEGAATVLQPDGESTVDYELDVPQADSLHTSALTVGAGVLMYSSGERLHVLEAATGESLGPPLEIENDTFCASDVAPRGDEVAGVTCGTDGTAELYRWSVGERPDGDGLALSYRRPNVVTLADGADTAAVAFVQGEVAVIRDDVPIEPPELTTISADHNDYARGWADLDPSGRWLVTRRDERGLELWRIDGDVVEAVGSLSHDTRYDPPLESTFVGSELAMSWNSGPRPTASAIRWSLDVDDLQSAACTRIGAITEDGREPEFEPRCEEGRADHEPPEIAPPPTIPPAGEADPATALDLEATRIDLPPGSFPSVVSVAEDSSVWVAASSADNLIRIGASGRLEVNPIGASETSVNDLEPAPRNGMWFTGFQTFGWMERDGEAQILEGFDDPSSMTQREGTVYAYVPAGPSILRATQQSAEFVALDESLDGSEAPAMATSGDEIWMALDADVGGTFPPALGRLEENGNVELTPLEGIATITSLIAHGDGSLWFAGEAEDGTGIIGRRHEDGELERFELAEGMRAFRLASGERYVWFVSDTALGRIDDEGEVVARPVPDAERLSGIAVESEDVLWATDSEGDAVHRLTVAAGT